MSVNLIKNVICFCAPSQPCKGYPQESLHFLSDKHYHQHRINHIEKFNSTAIPSSSCHDVDITFMHVPAPLLYGPRIIDHIFRRMYAIFVMMMLFS